MGQQVSLPLAQAGQTGINVRELADLSYEKSLGTARFMKSIRTRHKYGVVVVRLFGRPHENFDFKPYIRRIKRERELLAGVANALSYVRIVETPHAGYLCRQYLASSLYDRLSTRPFLEDVEKKWIAFQLLTAVRDCHNRDVYHGDIKTENVLVTSWNWLYLADFSSAIKPTYLPEDDPADYSYYFDTSGRRTCYLAPERFLRPGQRADEQGVTWAMDVFSAGCVIAELFLESPLFTLSSSIRYRDGDTALLDAALQRIEDPDIRELVAHMTQIEPESRYSAEEYLNFWRRKAFPEYFYSFLHQYLELLTDPSSGTSPIDPESTNFGDADNRIQRVFLDFEKISYFLDSADDDALPVTDDTDNHASLNVLPVQLDIPNQRHPATRKKLKRGPDDGSLIFLTLVVASLRNTARAAARIQACDVLLAFAERLSDTAKLDRVLPFLVVLLNDKSDDVKAAAVRSVVQLLDLVEVASPINAFVFTEYIKPRLQNMVSESKEPAGAAVRATYAACLASLAHSSARILDMTQSVRTNGPTTNSDPDTEDGVASGDSQRALYDGARADLVDHFVSHTKSLLTDPDASVRRAFLGSVSSLCVFFGPTRAADVVVSHLNTYLNDKDWMLKCAFFRTIVGVAAYIGSANFEDFVLPLMLQALTDPEEFVVERVISSFASMAEIGLFQKGRLIEMIDIVARFTMHPNQWIREAAIHFVSASQHHISTADMHGIVLQLIKPYLKINVTSLDELILLDALKKPLSRAVFDTAANWSLRVGKGVFWRSQKDQHTFSFRSPDHSVAAISSRDLTSKSLQKVPKNQEDEQWLNRLGNLGMNATEDGFKLLALREYIARTAKRRSERQHNTNAQTLNSQIGLLAMLEVLPETVVFEKQTRVVPDEREIPDEKPLSPTRKRGHTITDALLDASQSLGDAMSSPIEQAPESAVRPRLDIPRRSSTQQASSDGISSPSTAPGSPGGQSLRPALALVDPEGRRHSTTTLPDNARARPDLDRVRGLKHRSSAVSLLGKRAGSAGSYGSAQISTSAAHAEGEMDGPFHAEGGADDASSSTKVDDGKPKGPRREEFIGHTYRGTDPNVSKLLDNLAAHSALYDDAEFGPIIANKIRRYGSRQPGQTVDDGPYRPNGVLVATITEQNGAINQLLAAPDHNFFLSASDDGTVAVFDRQRFEKSLVHKPRLLYRHAEGAQIVALTFIQNTHTFVSCATDGSVHVVKVECSWIGKTLRIGGLTVKRSYQLRRGEHAVWCEHYKAKGTSQSILILVTNIGRIISLDLRSLNTLFTIEVNYTYGTPTTACLGSKKTWIIVGTSTGILALYDLRFHLLVRVWGFQAACPINGIQLYERPQYRDTTADAEHQIPLHDDRSDRNVIIAGGTGTNDVSIWDIEKCACVEVYRVGLDDAAPRPERMSKKASMPPNLATSKAAHRALDPVHVNEMKPHELLARLDATAANESGVDRSPRSLCVGALVPYHQPASQPASGTGIDLKEKDRLPASTSFVVTAGPDRRTRFWSCAAVDASAVVSGLAADEMQPTYRNVQSALSPGLIMHVEVPDPRSEEAKDNERRRLGRTLAMQREQNGLLKKHLDVITAVMVLEGNEGRYVVSGDRKGTILVFR